MMIKVVLLDLDDTLLTYPQGSMSFVAEYLKVLTDYLKDEHGLPNLTVPLLGSVKRLAQDLDPTRRNQDFYWDAVRQTLPNHSFEMIQLAFERFYKDRYPSLQGLTQANPINAKLVRGLLERGYGVVIATNPLYPQQAIEQRLAWAGLQTQDWAFARITHAENSHFSKPHPHYYEEILADLGYEPYEAIMVGDSWTNDIVPATKMGMHSFWITPKPQAMPQDSNILVPDGQGTLQDFADCVLNRDWLDDLLPTPPEPHQVMPRLLGDVGALFGLIQDIPERFWHQRPDPNEWSPMEIVHHLWDNEQNVQRPILQTIAAQDNPFINTMDEPPQPRALDLTHLDGHLVARDFAAERQKTIAFLADLAPNAWERPARHSIYGLTTLLEMALFTVRHDHLHIKQLCQTIGNCE